MAVIFLVTFFVDNLLTMIEGFGYRPTSISVCNEIVDESYESVEMGGIYVIIHTVVDNCGGEQKSIYPDVRRNLAADLANYVALEEYEGAALMQKHLNNLDYESDII